MSYQIGGTLEEYNAILRDVKARNGYKPGMGPAGKALLAKCRSEASAEHAVSKGKAPPTPRAAAPRAKVAAKPRAAWGTGAAAQKSRAKAHQTFEAAYATSGTPRFTPATAASQLKERAAARAARNADINSRLAASEDYVSAAQMTEERAAKLASMRDARQAARASRAAQQQGGYWF